MDYRTMNTLRTAVVLLIALLASTPTYAQWQTQNHSVPVGRGAGVTGFDSVSPGTTEFPLVSNGPSGTPTFSRRLQPAGGGTGVDNSVNAANDVLASGAANGSFVHTALMTLLNAVCTLTPTPCHMLFGYVQPEWFGALCNGTGDDGPAINSAINFASPVHVQLSPCVYRTVTAIVVNKSKVNLSGQGPHISVIDYEPGAAGTAITVGRVGATTFGVYLSGFSGKSADTTHTKYFINVIDISESHLRDITCTQTTLSGGIWTGNSGSGTSTCLLHSGSFIATYEQLVFYADTPIQFAPNPNTPLNASDHNTFRDLYLVTNGLTPCILVNGPNGPAFSNTTFEGRQAWARCSPGFQWTSGGSNPSGLASVNLSFSGLRTEQNFGIGPPTAYSFLIQLTGGNTLQNLTIENANFDSGARGMLLQGVSGATIRNSQKLCNTGAELVFVMDTTDQLIYNENNLWGANCTISAAGLTATLVTANPSGGTAPAFSLYTH
jgi:hypothetical protein